MAHALLILRLNGVFRSAVPETLGLAARVANLKGGNLVILAENGSVAAKLRQMTVRLQATFAATGTECKSIEIKLQPSQSLLKSTSSQEKIISGSSLVRLRELVGTLPPHSPLCVALTRLLERAPLAPSPNPQE